jgi:membrane protein implicated in regulation of membrane protease activity
MEFLNEMDTSLRALWYIALPTSMIFLLQTILTFIGSDSGDGINADFDGNLEGAEAPFQLFTLRNLINFLLGFSWTGITFFEAIPNYTVLLLLSTAAGLGFVWLFFIIIKQITKLAEDNTFKPEHSLQKTGTVYLSIPGHKQGTGKISISVKGSQRELNAITQGEQLETGSAIRVVGVEGGNLLLVEKI